MLKRNGIPETLEIRPDIGAAAGADWWSTREPDIPSMLAQLEPISLDEMSGVALLDRIETKFVFHENCLSDLLSALGDEYRVLEINGNRLSHYRTLYFDTPDFALFRRHQAGGRNRYKVRSRTYLDTDLSFLEVKHKVNKNRTMKKRMKTADFVGHLSSKKTVDFLNTNLPVNEWEFEPKLWNQYTRVTLVGRQTPERVTLDLNLQFTGDAQSVILPGLVIAEVKKSGDDHNLPFTRHMRAMFIRPTGFSKYCVGVSMIYEEVKHNSLKPTLRKVSKLIQGDTYYV